MTIFMSFWSFSPKLLTFVNFIHLASFVFGLVVKIWSFMRQLRTFFVNFSFFTAYCLVLRENIQIFTAEFSHFWWTKNWNCTISPTFLGGGGAKKTPVNCHPANSSLITPTPFDKEKIVLREKNGFNKNPFFV